MTLQVPKEERVGAALYVTEEAQHRRHMEAFQAQNEPL